MDRRRMEIAEAIDAGNRALEGLREAEKKLRSAGRWGLADLFGGGFVFDMIKHSKMESAVGWIDQVRGDLRIFVNIVPHDDPYYFAPSDHPSKVDQDGKGYHVIHFLEDIEPDTGGWINLL